MRTVLIVLGLLTIVLTASAQNDSASAKRFYGIKSGRIVWKFFAGFSEGERTIIFDDWGRVEKMYAETRADTIWLKEFKKLGMDSVPAVTHVLQIKTPTDIYEIDMDRKVGSRRDNYSLSDFFVDSVDVDATLIEAYNNSQKYVVEDSVLGRVCQVKESGPIRMWMWNGFALKTKHTGSSPTMRVEEYAIEIDENYQIKPDEFDPPEGIVIEE